jgi:hypothetical protein
MNRILRRGDAIDSGIICNAAHKQQKESSLEEFAAVDR